MSGKLQDRSVALVPVADLLRSVSAIVSGISNNNYTLLSKSAFSTLASLNVGMVDVQFWFTNTTFNVTATFPNATLSSSAVARVASLSQAELAPSSPATPLTQATIYATTTQYYDSQSAVRASASAKAAQAQASADAEASAQAASAAAAAAKSSADAAWASSSSSAAAAGEPSGVIRLGAELPLISFHLICSHRPHPGHHLHIIILDRPDLHRRIRHVLPPERRGGQLRHRGARV